MSDAGASLLADSTVQADLRGIRSHGVLRVPDYVAKLTREGVNPRGRPRAVSEIGGAIVVDGDNAMGQIAGVFAMRRAISNHRLQPAIALRAFLSTIRPRKTFKELQPRSASPARRVPGRRNVRALARGVNLRVRTTTALACPVPLPPCAAICIAGFTASAESVRGPFPSTVAFPWHDGEHA